MLVYIGALTGCFLARRGMRAESMCAQSMCSEYVLGVRAQYVPRVRARSVRRFGQLSGSDPPGLHKQEVGGSSSNAQSHGLMYCVVAIAGACDIRRHRCSIFMWTIVRECACAALSPACHVPRLFGAICACGRMPTDAETPGHWQSSLTADACVGWGSCPPSASALCHFSWRSIVSPGIGASLRREGHSDMSCELGAQGSSFAEHRCHDRDCS